MITTSRTDSAARTALAADALAFLALAALLFLSCDAVAPSLLALADEHASSLSAAHRSAAVHASTCSR